MATKEQNIDPHTLSKIKKINEENRKQMKRQANREKREADHQRKINAAIERFSKPIPCNKSRQLNQRMLPHSLKQQEDAELTLIHKHQQKEKELLFGDDI